MQLPDSLHVSVSCVVFLPLCFPHQDSGGQSATCSHTQLIQDQWIQITVDVCKNRVYRHLNYKWHHFQYHLQFCDRPMLHIFCGLKSKHQRNSNYSKSHPGWNSSLWGWNDLTQRSSFLQSEYCHPVLVSEWFTWAVSWYAVTQLQSGGLHKYWKKCLFPLFNLNLWYFQSMKGINKVVICVGDTRLVGRRCRGRCSATVSSSLSPFRVCDLTKPRLQPPCCAMSLYTARTWTDRHTA